MSAEMVEQIRTRVAEALRPVSLEVLDEGHLHVGHAGEGQGHYRVRVTSEAFAGLLPLKRHRLVYDAVGALMGDGIHALAIEAHAPGEAP
ncbi:MULTISPECIES: BolA family protein [Oleiagrimonas]|jgi:BolA family transcriptional regulator, general stress-responsive regulator|uniref:BolA family transcriptional regulator n=1 Tax=Oleiagrimonas citrea TaxID=1665687 RepID=A0A846ZIG4_9GAMM|nr:MULTISPECIES: BolA family protein [Oleiagrimonas]NKZ37433.1 BolA family transcriptional regulator [Oleiagrimonas citrea]RAP57935.1 BolA family transcriptional regulator [Oleiagrimonas sp. MCCC 1A03011]